MPCPQSSPMILPLSGNGESALQTFILRTARPQHTAVNQAVFPYNPQAKCLAKPPFTLVFCMILNIFSWPLLQILCVCPQHAVNTNLY
jgi:hypothetical protein